MNSNFVEWGVAARQMPGESICGDLHLVKPVDKGVLVVVADGLGHGRPAAEAAELAINVAAECENESLIRVLEHCNRKLRQTRGAVMSLAFFNALDLEEGLDYMKRGT
ncbi:MAG: SpoIIE family protein phosphatase [Acidobacteriota bacterium]